jgi:O-antigen/teichoic acid export membrane protein
MSLKRNILANHMGQAYVVVIGLVMLPVCVRYMRAEAYGLVGFFAMLQVWFHLLDMGLTPTVSRELSRFKAGILNRTQAVAMVRSTEWLFGVLGVVGVSRRGLAPFYPIPSLFAGECYFPNGTSVDEEKTDRVCELTTLIHSHLPEVEKQLKQHRKT